MNKTSLITKPAKHYNRTASLNNPAILSMIVVFEMWFYTKLQHLKGKCQAWYLMFSSEYQVFFKVYLATAKN